MEIWRGYEERRRGKSRRLKKSREGGIRRGMGWGSERDGDMGWEDLLDKEGWGIWRG